MDLSAIEDIMDNGQIHLAFDDRDLSDHGEPVELNALLDDENAESDFSNKSCVKFVNQFQHAYWRNNRKNLQCFPSCREHISYDKLVLGRKVHKDSGACHQPVRLKVHAPISLISDWSNSCVIVKFVELPVAGQTLPPPPSALSTADLKRMEDDRDISCVCYGTKANSSASVRGARTAEFQLRPPGSKSWHLEFKLTTNKRNRKMQKFALQADVYYRPKRSTQKWYLLAPAAISPPFSMGCTRTMERKRDSPASKKYIKRKSASSTGVVIPSVPMKKEVIAVKSEGKQISESQVHGHFTRRGQKANRYTRFSTSSSDLTLEQKNPMCVWQPEWLERMQTLGHTESARLNLGKRRRVEKIASDKTASLLKVPESNFSVEASHLGKFHLDHNYFDGENKVEGGGSDLWQLLMPPKIELPMMPSQYQYQY